MSGDCQRAASIRQQIALTYMIAPQSSRVAVPAQVARTMRHAKRDACELAPNKLAERPYRVWEMSMLAVLGAPRGQLPGCARPDSYASTTTCTRSRRWSFWRMCATWVLTVASLR